MAKAELTAPVTGTVWKIERAVGERVEDGDDVMILESMKMEVPVQATAAGTIVELKVGAGEPVEEDQVVCVIDL